MRKRKILYVAKWGQVGKSSIADVSFEAYSDEGAKREANRIARQLNVTHTPRTIQHQMTGRVVEVLNTGVSS